MFDHFSLFSYSIIIEVELKPRPLLLYKKRKYFQMYVTLTAQDITIVLSKILFVIFVISIT